MHSFSVALLVGTAKNKQWNQSLPCFNFYELLNVLSSHWFQSSGGNWGHSGIAGNSAFTPCTCWLQCLHCLVTSSRINLSNLLVIYCSPRCLQHAGMGFFWNWHLHLCCRLSGLIQEKWENLEPKKVFWECILFSWNGSISLFLRTEPHSDEAVP